MLKNILWIKSIAKTILTTIINDYVTHIMIDDCLYYLYGNCTDVLMRSRAHISKSIFLNWLQQHIRVSSWLQTTLRSFRSLDWFHQKAACSVWTEQSNIASIFDTLILFHVAENSRGPICKYYWSCKDIRVATWWQDFANKFIDVDDLFEPVQHWMIHRKTVKWLV